MASCTKTLGCVFFVPGDETGPCPLCAGFKVIADLTGTAQSPKSPKQCTQCTGTGTVKLVDNKTAQHAGPCKLSTDCQCDKDAAWASFAEQGHFCDVHQRRATLDPAMRTREAAAQVAGIAQQAADDAAYQAKIDAAVAAKRWVDVPEPRRSIEMAKVGAA